MVVRSVTSIREGRNVLLGMLAAILIVLLAAGSAQAAKPAIFEAGAAAFNINPDTPQYIGGYGYKSGPTTEVNDPLEVRAFFVGQGRNAAVMVSADSTGWFSAYEGPTMKPYGIDATRVKIAEALSNRGYNVTPESVLINSTHAHSTPVLVGIWGLVDWRYLKKVSTSAVDAAIAAADRAKKSELWAETGSVRSLVWQNGQGTNHPDGYEADNQLPVLWARDPQTKATNAIYVNIPNHPDQFRAEDYNKFSADVPGYVRKVLDEQIGGTAVVASGTLGRQEPPGSNPAYSEVIPQAEFDINQIPQTLGTATPVTRGGVDGAQERFTTEADNSDLLTLISGFMGAGSCIDEFEYCTIPRSRAPEYYSPAGGGDPATVTATTQAIRIGDVLIASNPGEAFPEVNRAIRESVNTGARQIHVAALTDMLGYYYNRANYNDEQIGSSNFNTYNVGPDLGQDNADAARKAIGDLGFATTPQVVDAPWNPDVQKRPGVQWYPNRTASANPTVSIYGSATRSQDKKAPEPTVINWDFGDGDTQTTTKVDGDWERFDHTFPGPGTYQVTATVSSEHSIDHVIRDRSWSDTITIDPPLEITARVVRRSTTAATLAVSGKRDRGHVVGSSGNGRLIAASWSSAGKNKGAGLMLTIPFGRRTAKAAVTAVDGAGNTATAQVKIPRAPALKVKLRAKTLRLKSGRQGVLRAVVSNPGGAAATGVKVCATGNRVAQPVRRCVKAGKLGAGKRKTIKLRLRGKKKGASTVKLTVKSGNAGSAKAKLKVRTR